MFRFCIVALSLSLALTLGGCGGSSPEESNPPLPSGIARTDLLNVMLNSPDAGVSVYAETTTLAHGLIYGDVKSRALISWVGMMPAPLLAFTANDSSNGNLLVGPVDQQIVDVTEYATLVVGDSLALGAFGGDFVIFEKDYTRPLLGNTRMTFVHAMPGIPAVDIYIQGAFPLRRVVAGLGYKDVSDYIETTPRPGAANAVIVTRAGVPPNIARDYIYIDDAVFNAQTIYIGTLMYEEDDQAADLTVQFYEQL